MAARIGDMLVAAGFVTEAQVSQALEAQKASGRRLGEELVALGFVSEVQLTQILSNQLSVPWVSLHHVEFSRELLHLIPAELADEFCCIPIYKRVVRNAGETLFVALDDPTRTDALEAIARAAGLPVKPMVAPPTDIRNAIRVYYLGAPPEPAPAPRTATRQPPPAEEEVAVEVPADAPTPAEARVEPAEAAEGADAGESAETAPPEEAAESDAAKSEPAPKKRERKSSFVTLTLLDGTTVRLPAKRDEPEEAPAPRGLTANDLVSALLARAQGADVDDILPPDARWETLMATVLQLLLKKGLVADWEFVEAFKKNQGR